MAAGTYSYHWTLNTWRIFRVLHLLIKFSWTLKAMSGGSSVSSFQTLTLFSASVFLNKNSACWTNMLHGSGPEKLLLNYIAVQRSYNI
jgi:hypothetical protein